MVDLVGDYWINKDDKYHECSNVSFFRFLGNFKRNLTSLKIFEAGFNNGTDLEECIKRGADAYGIDINPKTVDECSNSLKGRVKVSRAGIDQIPFEFSFDLIYTRDTICYLKDNEIEFFIKDAMDHLSNEGLLIMHFIETDLRLEFSEAKDEIDFSKFEDAQIDPIFPKENPIRFISSKSLISICEKNNLSLIGRKRLIQSYDKDETRFRIERYLAFKIKAN